MKYFKIILVFLIAVSCKEDGTQPQNEEDIDYNDFSKRTFELYVPPTYNANNPTPLVFAFHGYGGDGAGMRILTAFDDHAIEKNFIVCYPDAAVSNWNDGCNCNNASRLGIDDVGFVNYLIDLISQNYNVDTTKLFAAGYSQGGFFVNNLACKLSNRISKIAVVCGAVSNQLSQGCFPSNNSSVLMIQGTNDQSVLYNGVPSGNFSYLSAKSGAKFWGNKNGCDSEPVTENLPDNGDPAITVLKETYIDCNDNVSVILYSVFNGSHGWYKSADINTTETIVEFFFDN